MDLKKGKCMPKDSISLATVPGVLQMLTQANLLKFQNQGKNNQLQGRLKGNLFLAESVFGYKEFKQMTNLLINCKAQFLVHAFHNNLNKMMLFKNKNKYQ